MLKNKLKIIALFMVIILMLMVPVVMAEDNEADGQTAEQQAVVEGAEEQATQTAVTQENYKQGDVYLTGDEVTIDYIVDGNLFVFANTVNINSQIGGDAFIVANNIFVNEGGYIFSNLFALSSNITINGVVYDLYACSNSSININGYIYRDVRVITNDFTLSGTIGRNAYLNVNKINISTASTDEEGNTLTSQGSIYGDLNYTAKQELSIPEGIVTGDTNYTQATSTLSIQSYILSIGRFLATAIIIWLLCLWLTPKFLDRTGYILSKKLPSSIGFGILTPIVLIIASVILLLLEITSTIGGLGLVLLFAVCIISSVIFVIAINNLICQRLKIEKTIGKLGLLIITAAIIWLLALIPVVGGVISIIATLLGLGILINGILLSRKNINLSENKSEKTKNDNKDVKNKKAKK